MCVSCSKYDVEATLTGVLDVAPDKLPEGVYKTPLGLEYDGSGKLAGLWGFGHPPAWKYRLRIESVSEVAAQKLPQP